MKSSRQVKRKVPTRKKNTKNENFLFIICVALVLIGVIFCLEANVKVDVNDEIIPVGSELGFDGIKATWFENDISNLGKQTGEVNTNIVGEYVIEYRPFFSMRKYQKTVYVVDVTSPSITLIGNTEVYLDDINGYVEPGFTAEDNYDGNITSNVTSETIKYSENYYEIHYIVKDSSNNEVTATRKVHISKGTVYLTFDDGPSFQNTPQILDILERRGVKATFFVIGFNEEAEKIILREYESGHTIGYHGFSHDYAEIYQSLDILMNNFYLIEEKVFEITEGYNSRVIRFPGGSSNTVSKNYCEGIMTEAVKRAEEEGYIYYDWNVDSGDAGKAYASSEEIYQNVIDGIKPGQTNIVLMHDGDGHAATVGALERIIDYCINNGYELRAINENTVHVQHGVAN